MQWLDIPDRFLWAEQVLAVAAAILAALVAHAIAMRVARRALPPHATGEQTGLDHLFRPFQAAAVLLAVALTVRFLDLDARDEAVWRQLLGIVTPALLGWIALGALRASLDAIARKADISVEDNLRARRKRTRAAILGRVGAVAIVFLTICLVLLSIPGIRTVGVTLMASAGIVGLVVGAAAQPALKNLIAGIQMAFTEPIRLDDVVIVDAEWGRVEEIRLTLVVIRLWDDRRLVVPVSHFLEKPFQNWTRETSRLMGSVFWYVDPSADVPRLRAKLEEIVRANSRWDGRFFNLQVTDMKERGAVELRALVTARDASTAFDLRCDVREAMLAFLRQEMPGALLRERRTLGLADA